MGLLHDLGRHCLVLGCALFFCWKSHYIALFKNKYFSHLLSTYWHKHFVMTVHILFYFLMWHNEKWIKTIPMCGLILSLALFKSCWWYHNQLQKPFHDVTFVTGACIKRYLAHQISILFMAKFTADYVRIPVYLYYKLLYQNWGQTYYWLFQWLSGVRLQ